MGTALSNLQKIYGYAPDGNKYENSSGSSYGASYTTGDIIGVKFDADTRQLEFLKNNATQGVAFTVDSGYLYLPQIHLNNTDITINFGQEGSFAGSKTAQGNSDGNGYGDFYYAPPSGYLALCTQNLATELSPTIDDGSEYFNTILWTGNGSNPRSLTGVGFQPDWLWTKARNATFGHNVYDSSRGDDGTAYYRLETQDTASEIAQPPAGHVTSLDSDGFSVTNGSSSDNIVNNSGTTYVAWNWKANGGTTSSNSDGTITSTVQANTTAGFSIVTRTGTGANATVGHGLGVAPSMIISKNRDLGTGDWVVYHSGIGATKYLQLNQNVGTGTSAIAWNNTEPTSSVFSVGTWDSGNGSGNNIVSYCFAEIEEYSKMGTYTGNGNTDGTFVYTGFRPSWIMLKRTDGDADWIVFDSKRLGYNGDNKRLYPNRTFAEDTTGFDLLSNGFKARMTGSTINGSGNSYIYMAFAENPFVTSGAVPVTAR